MKPYYADDSVTLYCGDAREVLPTLTEQPVACVADPPYGETAAKWDAWPFGWVEAVEGILPASASLWMFGTTRMFLGHIFEFNGWKYAQEALWVKRNGSGPTKPDRLVRLHEWAYHWYRGRWSDLHHEWEREPYHGPSKSAKRNVTPQHRGVYGNDAYRDDGTRQPTSVTFVIESPTVRYQKRHQDEKPLAVVMPLVRECTPPGGLVLDPFAGSGTTGVAAQMTGRRALLIEKDEAACEIAAQRLSEPDLLAMAADHLGQPMADMPKTHRVALDAVQWPEMPARPAVAPYLPAAAAPEGITDIALPGQAVA